jgi:P-type Ca2+ transporter type 2C
MMSCMGELTTATGPVSPVGLTSEEAAGRLASGGPNELPTAKKRNIAQQAWDVISQPMLLLLLGAGTINFVLSEPLDGIILMSFVIVVIAISIFQEHKTENALAALRDLSSPRALVVRDGRQQRIAGRDVVPGDVVLLAEGDRVPADSIVADSVNLSVDESALTGESVPVRKVPVATDSTLTGMGRPGGEATPFVFSGTLVVKGQGTVMVQTTGAGTELGRIGTVLRTIEPERTRLQREIERLVRVIAGLGLIAAAAVVVVFGLTRHHWLEGLLAGIGTAMAMLPEEFPVVLTVFLALGAWRMSQRNVLTRRSPVIETLGSATAICVDKTGTLTMNSMTVRQFIVGGSTHVLDGGPLPESFHEVAEFAILASPVHPFDPMDRAFTHLATTSLANTEHVHKNWELVREYPLSETLLALSQVWRSPDADDYVIAAKGAPEAIADLCHLDQAEWRALSAEVEAAAASGLRVLAVARARFTMAGGLPTEQHDFAFEFLGLGCLHDPVRPGVADAVAECRRAGIRVVMITGDHPATALAIAREIDLDHSFGCVTGDELRSMSADELARRIRTVSIFARMVPEQKLELVRALQANGDVVAMTGDGVNDAPALRAADIGIAMGARGTDVARESAGLVLTDDDFSSIVGGVRQGRGIFDNLRKAMSYIIAVHVPIFGMSLIPVFVAGWPLVLLPVQIAFLELIIDPACSIVFESEEIDPEIMNQPPRPVGQPMFSRRVLAVAALQGLSELSAVTGVYLWAVLDHRTSEVVRSITFATLVAGNLALILVNRSWRLSLWQAVQQRRNRTLKWILAAAATILVGLLTIPRLRTAFKFGPLRPTDWLVAVAAGFAGIAWFEVYKARTRRSVHGIA